MADFGISEAILAASAAASAAGGIAAARMGGGKLPALIKPPPMPDNGPQQQIAEERKQEGLAASQGRQSTALSNDSRPTSLLASVGAPTYSNRLLGS